nr:hypothetical protein BgiMline_011918 [Biomphalaria glabrata]
MSQAGLNSFEIPQSSYLRAHASELMPQSSCFRAQASWLRPQSYEFSRGFELTQSFNDDHGSTACCHTYTHA